MKKKFTMLLASLFLVLGSAWAETAIITNLARLTDDLSCTVSTASRGGWAVNADGNEFGSTNDYGFGTTVDPTNSQHLFQFKKIDDSYYLYSVHAKKYVNNNKGLSETADQAIEFIPQSGGTFVVKFVNSHYINLGGSNQMVINSWGTADAGNMVTITAVSVDPKTKLSWLVDDVQSSNVFGKIPLQTTDATGAYYLSATVKGDAPIDKAIDNNPSTYYGSTWQAEVGSRHYWQVDLGEGVTLNSFVFSYVTRANGKDTPTQIDVKGSMDGTDFAEIVSLTKDADGLPTAGGASYTSEEIANTNNYRYIRFEVPSTTSDFSQPGKPEQEVTIAIAEFSLINPDNEAWSDEDKAMQAALATAEDLLAASNVTDKQYEDAYTAIKMAPVKKPVYPFTVTTDDAAPVLYAIKSGRDNEGKTWWYTYDATDGKISLSEYSETDTQYWLFKEVVTDDYAYALQLLPYADKTKAMSYENTNNGAAKIVAKEDGTEGWTNLWLLASTDGQAPYGLQTYDKANYLSNNGGYKNKMGMWAAAPNSDPGTAMYIYTPAEVLQDLIAEAESMLVKTDVVGYLTSASAVSLKSAIDNAKAQLADKNYSVQELKAAIDNVDIVLPQADKYYQLISGMQAFSEKKAIYSNRTAPVWKTLDGTDKSFYWTIVPDADGESYTFCNVQDGMYLNGTTMALVDTAKTTAVTKLKFLAVGEFNIVSNNITMHASGHAKGTGTEGTIINYPSGPNDASSWMIVEVDHPDLAMEKAALEQRIAELNAITKNAGTVIGEYKEEEAAKLVAPLATAQAVMDGGSAVPSVYTEALKNLNETVSSFDLTIILPTAGKYYQLRSAVAFAETKAVYSDGSNPKWKKLNEDDDAFYWMAVENEGGIALKNAADGKFMNGNATQSGDWSVSDTPANIDVKIFSKEENANGYQYGVIIDDWQLHAAGHDSGSGTQGAIVSYNTDAPGSASAWYLVEIDKKLPITYIYKNGENVLTREVVKERVGMPYPAATAILPLGYTATNLEGVVSAEDTEKVIVCDFNEAAIPFKYYESFGVVEQWYYLKLSGAQNYLYYVEKDSVLDASKTEYAIDNRVAYAWAFVGNPLDGFQVVNKKAAETMGLKAAEDGAVVGEGGDIFKLTPSSDIKDSIGFYMAATKSEKNQRFNKQGGKVVYWSGADSGSTFTVAQCLFGPVAELNELIGTAGALMETVEDNTGDKIGEYTQATADALAAAIATAKSKIDDPTEADVTALTNAIVGTKITLPAAAKYYQLRSALGFADTKAVYSDGSNPKWKTLNEVDKTFYWQAVKNEGGIALKNAADGKFMNGNATQSGAWSVSDTPVSIDVKIFSKEENDNGYQYGIILNNWQLHAAGHDSGRGTAGTIVSYNTDAPGSASAWYLVEVELPQFYTITYNFKYDGDIKYTQTATLVPGAEFPDFSITLPYGVVIATEKPAGTVTEDKAFDFDLKVEKELPFVAAASVDDINTWYYVQMHANSAVTAYLEDNGGNNIEWVDKSVESSEIDSYLWGYVGDVWNGIKMVNKGTGRAIVSTSGDAVLGDAAKATAFIPANSQAGGNWFCLRYPESNYLNAQGSKVASYNDNDNGSSFLLTEYKVYALEVPSIGYGTFYSDNKLEIPETVQAYVATSVNAGEVILEQVTGVIPAHTGIIFSGGEGVHNFVVSAATATAEFEINLLRGTTTKTLITPEAGSTYYVLEEGAIGAGLYIATLTEEDGTAFYNNANEAYLLVQTPVDQSEPVLTFRFGKQDGTKIEEAELNTQLPTVIYDLTGRRIPEIVEKGIYIINGKKVVVK